MGFYDYFYGQNKTSSAAVAQDADVTGGEPKELVTIRRFFKVNKDLQKKFGHEDNGGEEEQQKPSEGEEAKAQDEAVAEDALSKRHLSTPLSECKAEKPLFCRYHGAAWMTKTLDEEFKKAGIWAKGGVERMRHGNYKIQYSVPPSKKDAANAIIDKFLNQKEKDAEGKETPSLFEVKEDDKGDEVDAIEKTAKRTFNENQFVERSERIARLEKDTEKADYETQKAVSQLKTDNYALEELAKKAWEARTEAGLAQESSNSNKFKEWAAQNEDWQKYRAAESKFHDDYNYLRANQDLGHLQTSADVIELMDHLNNQIDKVGAYIKADAALKELKAKMGIKQMPKNLSITEEYKAATSEVGFLGKQLSAAHEKCVEANESGDIKKQRAAAHELEIILRDLEDNKEAVDKAYEVAKKYEDYLNSHSIEQMKEESKKSTEEKKAKEAALAAEKAEKSSKGGSGSKMDWSNEADAKGQVIKALGNTEFAKNSEMIKLAEEGEDWNQYDIPVPWKDNYGIVADLYKKDGSVRFSLIDHDSAVFSSKDFNEVLKKYNEAGKGGSESKGSSSSKKSEPKSAASQYTANLNKSKGSAAKPASKETTKDVATGDPMIDGIVSTAFNFVKSGKKATTIPLPEDVPYFKIAKALNELGCQTVMSGEPDSKDYGIVVSPPKED